jgi:hypothetical protein
VGIYFKNNYFCTLGEWGIFGAPSRSAATSDSTINLTQTIDETIYPNSVGKRHPACIVRTQECPHGYNRKGLQGFGG